MEQKRWSGCEERAKSSRCTSRARNQSTSLRYSNWSDTTSPVLQRTECGFSQVGPRHGRVTSAVGPVMQRLRWTRASSYWATTSMPCDFTLNHTDLRANAVNHAAQHLQRANWSASSDWIPQWHRQSESSTGLLPPRQPQRRQHVVHQRTNERCAAPNFPGAAKGDDSGRGDPTHSPVAPGGTVDAGVAMTAVGWQQAAGQDTDVGGTNVTAANPTVSWA